MQTRQRSVERQQPPFERSLSKRLTQSMDRGLAPNMNISTLSIPNRMQSRESDEEGDEYLTKEQQQKPSVSSSSTLPKLGYLRPGAQTDASIGAFNNNNNNNSQAPPVIGLPNKKSTTIPNIIGNRNERPEDDEFYTVNNILFFELNGNFKPSIIKHGESHFERFFSEK